MDNINNTVSNDPTSEQKPKKGFQRPFTDLREVLNKKRLTKQTDIPPDPKYNFLSDPVRDKVEKSTPEVRSSGRHSQRYNFDHRGRQRGRGRGRGYGNGYNNYRQNLEESDNAQQCTSSERYQSENKNEDVNVDKQQEVKSKPKNSQFRLYRGNYQDRRYMKPPKTGHTVEEKSEIEEKPQGQNNLSNNNRRNFPYRGRSSHQYYTHNNYSYKQNKKPLEPVNITVEFTVSSGARKCTIEKSKEPIQGERHGMEKCVETKCEENLDDKCGKVACKESSESVDTGKCNQDSVRDLEEQLKNLKVISKEENIQDIDQNENLKKAKDEK